MKAPDSARKSSSLRLSSDGAVTNVVLALATPLSFVCLLESDLWSVQNWNGLQPLTHLSVCIWDKNLSASFCQAKSGW